MKLFTTSILLLAAGLVAGHMEMRNPPPLRSSFNPHTKPNDIDYDMASPLAADGSNFPCRGSVARGLLGTSEGAAVATWAAGETHTFTLTGHTTHDGGSCQASVSVDGGQRFVVVKSWVGACPASVGDTDYTFSLPPDTPATKGALFAWTWFNNEGNREMYMNCAVVDVTPAAAEKDGDGDGDGDARPFGTLPDIFVANIGNGICTYEGTDVEFPDPGPDVVRNSRRPHAPGKGTCSTWGGNGDRGGF